jgi:hypothetical protein
MCSRGWHVPRGPAARQRHDRIPTGLTGNGAQLVQHARGDPVAIRAGSSTRAIPRGLLGTSDTISPPCEARQITTRHDRLPHRKAAQSENDGNPVYEFKA